jgi:lipopolysaccharide transport system permease protein
MRHRELLWLLALSEIKAKHRQTALGLLWAVIQPVGMAAMFTLVFSVFVQIPVNGVPYPIFAYTGLVCWLFVSNSLSLGLPSVVGHANLVTKANFPREVIPLAKVVTALVDLMVGGVVLLVALLIVRGSLPLAVFVLPLIFLVHLAFSVGLVLWGSALYVRRRDIGSILPLGLQLWMFATPIVYPLSVVPDRFQPWILMLNPLAGIIETYRQVLLWGALPSPTLFLPAIFSALGVLVSGYWYFKSVEPQFADLV